MHLGIKILATQEALHCAKNKAKTSSVGLKELQFSMNYECFHMNVYSVIFQQKKDKLTDLLMILWMPWSHS